MVWKFFGFFQDFRGVFLGFFLEFFSGEFFGRIFLGGFLGGFFWKEFNKKLFDLFVKILVFVKILYLRKGRKEEENLNL